MNSRYKELTHYIKELGSLGVAFSGGVDSSFLMKAAKDALGDKAVAFTVVSVFVPGREFDDSEAFCRENYIKQVKINFDPMKVKSIVANPHDRCYICKKTILTMINASASEFGIKHIAEGSNFDDASDYRPGMKAVKELEVLSPLKELKFTKAEIRQISKELGLDTWDKSSFACLASRIPYGERITEKNLRAVELSEQYLFEKGLKQFRVRVHGDLARIEVLPEDMMRFYDESFRNEIHDRLRDYGFTFVSLDLKGYRTGSLNERIKNNI